MSATAVRRKSLLNFTESHTSTLDDLLVRVCEEVQLSNTEYDLARSRYETIGKWLDADGSALAPFRPDIYPQGSIAIHTAIKPFIGKEYDVDLVCEFRSLRQDTVKDPIALLDAVEGRLAQNELYRNKLELRIVACGSTTRTSFT
jgi:hypothetical protein